MQEEWACAQQRISLAGKVGISEKAEESWFLKTGSTVFLKAFCGAATLSAVTLLLGVLCLVE